MTYREEVIEKIKKQYPYLSSKFGVQRIGLFGSIAKQMENEKSDIDILVEFDRPIGLKFMLFVEYMEKLLGRKVDVLTKEGIRNIRINKLSTNIEKDIIYV
jgi:predicted nucleotidyltransferase